MADKNIIICEESAEDFLRLAKNDVIVFVKTSDNRAVFKYEKSETQKYNNGFVAVLLRENGAYPFALSLSSILAPYKKTNPFDGKGLAVGFSNNPKYTHADLLSKGTKVAVKNTAIVQFTAKSGKDIDWNVVHLERTADTYSLNDEEQALVDEFVEDYLAKHNK
jgi:hypothetical protein